MALHTDTEIYKATYALCQLVTQLVAGMLYKLAAVVDKAPDGLRRKSHCKHKKPLLDGAPRHPAPIAMYGMAYQ